MDGWVTTGRYGIILWNVALCVMYVAVVWSYRKNVQYLHVPWTWRQTMFNDFWNEESQLPEHDSPHVWETLLEKSGCSEGTVSYPGGLQWSEYEKSGTCQCLHMHSNSNTTFESKGDIRKRMIGCNLAYKPSTTQGLFDENESLYVSNAVGIIVAWNLITLIVDVRYAGLRGLVFGGAVEEIMSAGIVTFASFTYFQIFPDNTAVAIWYTVCTVIFFLVLGLLRGCVWKKTRMDPTNATETWEGEPDNHEVAAEESYAQWIMYDWLFWLSYMAILPMAVILYNISNQRCVALKFDLMVQRKKPPGAPLTCNAARACVLPGGTFTSTSRMRFWPWPLLSGQRGPVSSIRRGAPYLTTPIYSRDHGRGGTTTRMCPTM